MQLPFYPVADRWPEQLAEARALTGAAAIAALRALARTRLDFLEVTRLDRALIAALQTPNARASLPTLRLALLSTSTTAHLAPAIRVAALARGLLVDLYEGPFGAVQQELIDTTAHLHTFRPDVVLLSFDAHHVTSAPGSTPEDTLATMAGCWAAARQLGACTVVQQTLLPVFPPLLGNNEQQLPASPASLIDCINAQLRPAADSAGVHLLALDVFSRAAGLAAWYEPALWHRSKHEVHPRAALVYADHLARLLASLRGLSSKCLVLDLDNTLWGGVIGDDGLEGIVLGQGNAVGEAHLSFQRYCAALAGRGVVLAVCSKNDEANARLPFTHHPEMLLRETDIAVFTANWTDKATNLRHIAQTLQLGLDSLVFVDDNPAERALVRRELPEVQVPELPDDPALFTDLLAGAGYFEATRITDDDRQRAQLYHANALRCGARGAATDLASYLQSLDMVLTARPFDELNLARVTQLINKTNQFNLTTQRMVEAEVRALIPDPCATTLQFRLADRFGDNGTIAVLIARASAAGEAVIHTWLMSCRVLGRRVEEACLHVLMRELRRRGIHRLIGLFRPTAKNCQVRDLYPRLGFAPLPTPDHPDDPDPLADVRFVLNLDTWTPPELPIHIVAAEPDFPDPQPPALAAGP